MAWTFPGLQVKGVTIISSKGQRSRSPKVKWPPGAKNFPKMTHILRRHVLIQSIANAYNAKADFQWKFEISKPKFCVCTTTGTDASLRQQFCQLRSKTRTNEAALLFRKLTSFWLLLLVELVGLPLDRILAQVYSLHDAFFVKWT